MSLLLIILIFTLHLPSDLYSQEIPNSLLSDLTWGLYTRPLDDAYSTGEERNGRNGAYLFGGITLPSEEIEISDNPLDPFEIGLYDSLSKTQWATYLAASINNIGEQKENYTEHPESSAETVIIISTDNEDSYTWYNERRKYIYTGKRPEVIDLTAAFLLNPLKNNEDLRAGFTGHYLFSLGCEDEAGLEDYFSSNYSLYTSYFYNNAADGEVPSILPVYHITQEYAQPLYRNELDFTLPLSWSRGEQIHSFKILGGLSLDDRDYSYYKSWIPVEVQQPESFTAIEETIKDTVTNYNAGLSYTFYNKLKEEEVFTSFLDLQFSGLFKHYLARNKAYKFVSQDYSAKPATSESEQEVWASFRHEIENTQTGKNQFGGEVSMFAALPFYFLFWDFVETSIAPGFNLTLKTDPLDAELITEQIRTIKEDFTGDADFGDEADRISTYTTTYSQSGINLDSSLSARLEIPVSAKIALFKSNEVTENQTATPFELIISLKCWGEYSLDYISRSTLTEETTTTIQDGLGTEIQEATATKSILSSGENLFSDNWSFGWDYRLGCRIDLKNGNSLDIQLNTDDLFKFESLTFNATLQLF